MNMNELVGENTILRTFQTHGMDVAEQKGASHRWTEAAMVTVLPALLACI
jgi:hypothetical protein